MDRLRGYINAHWLLNLVFMTLDHYPEEVPTDLLIPPESLVSDASAEPFRNDAAESGLGAVSLSAGAVADNLKSEGWLDLLVSSWQLRFSRNRGIRTFPDQTDSAGLTGLYVGLNTIQADYHSDGDLDLFEGNEHFPADCSVSRAIARFLTPQSRLVNWSKSTK